MDSGCPGSPDRVKAEYEGGREVKRRELEAALGVREANRLRACSCGRVGGWIMLFRMTKLRRNCSLFLAAMTIALVSLDEAEAQPAGFNYDEAKVPAYTLPDPLLKEDGTLVTKRKEWEKEQRLYILRQFEEHVYGRMPAAPQHVTYEFRGVDKMAFNGLATRKEVVIHLTKQKDGPTIELLLYVPNQRRGGAPVFVSLNFYGNHTISDDPGITLSTKWMRSNKEFAIVNNRATEASRGKRSSRWPVEMILERGYAVATAYYGDIEPDHAEGWKDGVRGAFNPEGKEFKGDDWGAIGAWAWGMSRMVDYLEKDRDIDDDQILALGHSRLGKTALWAGATDERFAITYSNNSGCGGAALSRRAFGETVARINTSFPHWFNDNFTKYNGKENECPVDQHELIALMAPRPVYIASAEQDQWADPKGEFLSGVHAGPVYELFKKTGLGTAEMPPVNTPVGDHIGYHIRTGKHDVLEYDWEQYMNFADRHFGRKVKLQE